MIEGPAAVGTFRGTSFAGAYDMAGNVREWSSTAWGEDRYLLGGGWNDGAYAFVLRFAGQPWERALQNGLRCASYLGAEGIDRLKQPVSVPETDIEQVRAASFSDEVYDVLRSATAYELAPLRPELGASEENPRGYRMQMLAIDAAYDHERLPIRLHLPPDGFAPPHQAVVFFPGAWGLFFAGSKIDDADYVDKLDFVVRGGRMLVEPIYAGMYQRNDGTTWEVFLKRGRPWQSLMDKWSMDISRTLDYLEQRDDVDATKIAFLPASMSATLPQLLAYEPRFKAAVYLGGGLGFRYESQTTLERSVGWAKRVSVPVLMMNGRYDVVFPYETNQVLLFEAWGTPAAHKKHVVLEGGHYNDLPRAQFIREVSDWLDRYLGPVSR
jgi:dienelactone hydrolase